MNEGHEKAAQSQSCDIFLKAVVFLPNAFHKLVGGHVHKLVAGYVITIMSKIENDYIVKSKAHVLGSCDGQRTAIGVQAVLRSSVAVSG